VRSSHSFDEPFRRAITPVADKGANVYPYLTACPACRNYMNICSEYGISTPKSKSLPDMKPGGRVSALLNARLFKSQIYLADWWKLQCNRTIHAYVVCS
jgi:hypothetical protein